MPLTPKVLEEVAQLLFGTTGRALPAVKLHSNH